MKTKVFIKHLIKKWRERRSVYRNMKEGKRIYSELISGVTLSDSEIREINTLWGSFIPKNYSSYVFHLLYKKLNGFDARYVPNDLYMSILIHILNPRKYADAFANKMLYAILFQDTPRPAEPIRNIEGYFYDTHSRQLTEKESLEILLACGKKLIVKSGGSSCGNSVRLLEHYDGEDLRTIFSEYKENFLFQEAINQSAQMACLNPSSVNTIRITTLLLNGKLSILHRLIRCGCPSAVVDNVAAGGIIVEIHSDGTLHDFGFDEKGHKHFTAYNKYPFAGHRINSIDEAARMVECLHYKLPFCAIIGWDIALAEGNKPLLIEMNTRIPGISYQQMCAGPLFGDRTSEVIQYVQNIYLHRELYAESREYEK